MTAVGGTSPAVIRTGALAQMRDGLFDQVAVLGREDGENEQQKTKGKQSPAGCCHGAENGTTATHGKKHQIKA